MLARTGPSAHGFVDACLDQTRAQLRVEQQVIDAQARVALPSLAHVIPERVDRTGWMPGTDGIGPPEVEQLPKRGAALRLDQGVVVVRARWINVARSRHDVVVARKHHRRARRVQALCMLVKALQPREFMVEFGARLWIAVGRIQAANQYSVDRSLEI